MSQQCASPRARSACTTPSAGRGAGAGRQRGTAPGRPGLLGPGRRFVLHGGLGTVCQRLVHEHPAVAGGVITPRLGDRLPRSMDHRDALPRRDRDRGGIVLQQILQRARTQEFGSSSVPKVASALLRLPFFSSIRATMPAIVDAAKLVPLMKRNWNGGAALALSGVALLAQARLLVLGVSCPS